MPNLQKLDREIHKNLRVQEEASFSVCRELTMCQITVSEIPRLALEYPLAFTRAGNSGGFVCVALFGIDPSRNLFWRDGRWECEFMPLNVARQPFDIGLSDAPATPEGTRELVPCIDMDNPGVQESSGERLFDDEGKGTQYLQFKLGMLSEFFAGEQRTRQFVERLVALELIRPIQVELKAPGAETRKFSGLFSIDEQKLRGLEAATLAELNASGQLQVIHTMLSSLARLQILARRAGRLTA